VITNAIEYQKAQDELEHLEGWLKRMEREHPLPDMGLSKAGIRKMIARLHEELGAYEGTLEVDAAKV
jgi:hypothetical protein